MKNCYKMNINHTFLEYVDKRIINRLIFKGHIQINLLKDYLKTLSNAQFNLTKSTSFSKICNK